MEFPESVTNQEEKVCIEADPGQRATTVRGMRDTVLFTVLLCPSCTSVPQAESIVSARAAAVKSAQSFFIVVSPCPLSVTR